MDDNTEKWLPIPEYEGIYEASNLGRIRTTEGKTTYTKRHGTRMWKQRILAAKVTVNKYGRKDERVTLWKSGKPKSFLVARLIAMTWCSGYSEKLTVNHKDGNPLNNRASNLEWLTRKDNILHAFSHGLIKSQHKTTLVSGEEIFMFCSMEEASRFLGKKHGYIYSCIKKRRNAKDLNGRLYTIILQTAS